MSAPELLTPREQQLLAAVRELLDIPEPAESDGNYRRYQDELALRASWLCGYLSPDLYKSRADVMVAAFREHADKQLYYEPKRTRSADS